METISQARNIKHKNVILVYDLDCVAAVMYHLRITSPGMFKDHEGNYYAAFTYNTDTQVAIEAFEKGLLKVNANGYASFYEDILEVWGSELDFFDRTHEDEIL